jgi:hypothetical protein
LPSDAVGDIIFPLFMIELVDGNLVLLRHRLHRIEELLSVTCRNTTGEVSVCPVARA